MAVRTFTCLAVLMLAAAARGAPPEISAEDRVDPLIGTPADGENASFGADIPGPCVPHGSIHPSPDTLDPLPSGYDPAKPIVGFAQLHALGTGGNPSYGLFLLTPRLGLATTEDEAASPKRAETPRAYSYAVDLVRDGIHAEIAPARHSALYRFTFPESTEAHLTLDVARKVGGEIALDDGWVEVDPATGALSGGGRYSKNYNPVPYRAFFAARVSQAPAQVGTWVSEEVNPGAARAAARGQSLGAYLRLHTSPGHPVELKIAVSFTSAEQAARWLDAEIPAWDFDGLRSAAAVAWHRELSRVSIPGASPAEARKFYTALWHSLTQPRDRTGDMPGFDPAQPLWDDHYTLWDTWQTLFPLLAIVEPAAVRDNVRSFINRFHHSPSGYVAEAFIQGKEFKIGQGGNETDNVIADAFAKQIPGIDWEEAYKIVKHNADLERTAHYRDHGWMASDERTDYSYRIRSGSATLAYAYEDFLAARMAAALGHRGDAARYLARSGSWRNVWDPGLSGDGFTGFCRGRDSTGRFSLTPADKGYNTDFYEGTCWEYSFSVPHDIPGLVGLVGGRDAFIRRLEHALAHDYIDFTNEPSFRIPWLFDQVGRPYLTCHWADVLRRKYTDRNLPGDDDSGAMSSLYVFLTSGFFPIAGQDVYDLHGARVPRVEFHLDSGRTFTVTADNAGERNPYVQSATLDGRPLDTPRITHADILAGRTLHFVMGPAPSAWGTAGGFDPAVAAQETGPSPP